MIRRIEDYGVRDAAVLAAMRRVRRDRFIPAAARPAADCFGDHPLPIGLGQTISQPYIVAYMTALLGLRQTDGVLEIGSGSGYQAAVLACLVERVYSVERLGPLATHARSVLAETGFHNVEIRHGDGFAGWPEHAPFNAIIVTCAPPSLPEPLIAQLADGGRMIAPVGTSMQRLVLTTREGKNLRHEKDIAVRFVPMLPECA